MFAIQLAVHDILRKTSFAPEKRDADREKRSVSEDSDPYDPEDGKDLLAAYMANVAQYRRETRSVDEEEEEDEGTSGEMLRNATSEKNASYKKFKIF